MRPDTSHWRDRSSYDIFDTLPVEGLAWECLRRHEPYQGFYQSLVAAKEDALPLAQEIQTRWGLRFPGSSRPVCPCPEHLLVPRLRPDDPDPYASFRHARHRRTASAHHRTRRRSR
ncbi:transcriptional regulator domain-containing protein [Brucella anthropi]|uniref:transcriptional regulator domain-containing protein n=1 Tax=Brucella anthropi TaxID=529 RepID=UPI001F2FD0B9|nr:DUF6499 domain-containing protein [Brucella anthropi]